MGEDQMSVAMESRIARVETLLESLKEALLANMGRQDKTLERIELQTTKTNGGLIEAKNEIKDLKRVSGESIEAQLKFREDQLFDRKRLDVVERKFFKYSAISVAIAVAFFTVEWCANHGILQWKPADYHAATQ